jgi:hypothetical protein
MHRSESEFCLHQVGRLSALANGCADHDIQTQLNEMAKGWAERGSIKRAEDDRSKSVALKLAGTSPPESTLRRG